MTAKIIDGKIIAAELRARVAAEVARVKRDHQLTPGLAVVLVGHDPASEVYVRSKHTQTQAAGMASFEHKLPADVSQADLLAIVAKLNRETRGEIAAGLKAGIAAGRLRPDIDLETESALILAGLRGSVAQWLVDPEGVDLEAISARFIATVEGRLAK